MNCIVWIVDKEWNNVFTKLFEEGVITVKVALISPLLEEFVFEYWRRRAMVINSHILQKGVFPSSIKDEIYYSSLINNSMKNYAPDIFLADIMMDRIDPFPDESAINPFERRYYIKKMISFWEKIIKEYEINLVLFSESPHWWHTYLLFTVIKKNNIKYYFSSITVSSNLKAISTEIGFPSKLTEKNLYSLISKEELFLEFQKKIKKLRSSYVDALPIYMKKQANIDSINKLNFWKGRAMQFIKGFDKEIEEIQNYFARTLCRKDGIGIDSNNYFKKEVIERKKKKNKLKFLQKKYENLAILPNLTEKYVYFPLHYQPERTSNPEGLFYEDQLMIINLLEKILPNNYYIYVKEHKSQFYTSMFGEQGRWNQFYEKCLLSSRVKLLNMNSNQFEIIDHAELVITITGTAGFESLCRNKKVISFGKSWYRSFHGVLDCSEEINKNSILKFLYEDIEIEVINDIKHLIELSYCIKDIPKEQKIANMLKLTINNNFNT